MKHKDIIDNIVKKADIRTEEYSVDDRIQDVNNYEMELKEVATQIDSFFPPRQEGEVSQETFTIEDSNIDVEGTFSDDRTIKNTIPVEVFFKREGSSVYRNIPKRTVELEEDLHLNRMLYEASSNKIIVRNARSGTLMVKYEQGAFIEYTRTMYDDTTNESTPSWMPNPFHNLLWMKPALDIARTYNTERVAVLEQEHSDLFELFQQHWLRNKNLEKKIETRVPYNYR